MQILWDGIIFWRTHVGLINCISEVTLLVASLIHNKQDILDTEEFPVSTSILREGRSDFVSEFEATLADDPQQVPFPPQFFATFSIPSSRSRV